MQQLNPNQLQAISGGVFESATSSVTNLFFQTTDAFKRGLTTSEAGVGLVGAVIGAGLAACTSRTGKVVGATLVTSYVAYSYFQPDLSGLTSMFSFGSTPAQDTTTAS